MANLVKFFKYVSITDKGFLKGKSHQHTRSDYFQINIHEVSKNKNSVSEAAFSMKLVFILSSHEENTNVMQRVHKTKSLLHGIIKPFPGVKFMREPKHVTTTVA